jgi:hypothetical protein
VTCIGDRRCRSLTSQTNARHVNVTRPLLALDRNANGVVDAIDEISFVGDKAGARTDLEGLAAFDSNGDGKLTGEDARFVEFKLWFDNGDGQTDAGELLSLAEANISEINLVGVATGQSASTSNGGNVVFNTSSFTRSDGASGTVLDAGFAYERLAADSSPETSPVPGAGSGSVTPANVLSDDSVSSDQTATSSPLPALSLQTSSWERKAKRYLVEARAPR